MNWIKRLCNWNNLKKLVFHTYIFQTHSFLSHGYFEFYRKYCTSFHTLNSTTTILFIYKQNNCLKRKNPKSLTLGILHVFSSSESFHASSAKRCNSWIWILPFTSKRCTSSFIKISNKWIKLSKSRWWNFCRNLLKTSLCRIVEQVANILQIWVTMLLCFLSKCLFLSKCRTSSFVEISKLLLNNFIFFSSFNLSVTSLNKHAITP